MDPTLISNNLDNLRLKLSKGKSSIGSWIQLSDPSVIKILSSSNYDWLAIDLEHGDIEEKDLPVLTSLAHSYCPLVFARVRAAEQTFCSRALDLGVDGIIIPKIESAENLIKIRNAIYYPPDGCRGVGYSNTNLYGKYLNEHLSKVSKPFLVAMIETLEGLNNLETILKVDGLDSILIGPYDLSASLSLPGKLESKEVINAINHIKSSCQKNSIPIGIHIVEPSIDKLKAFAESGFTFIAYGIDSVFLRSSSQRPYLE